MSVATVLTSAPDLPVVASALDLSLGNSTPTLISYTVPADGNGHPFEVVGSFYSAAATTGGQVNLTYTLNGVLQTVSLLQSGNTGLSTQRPFCGVADPGTTITVAQTTGLTAGSAVGSLMLLSSRATMTYDAYLRTLAPSGWWKLSDAVGSLTAADSSGNGYTGTVNGGVTFGQPGPIAGAPQDTAALFDGTSGYVAVGTEAALAPFGTDFTVLGWIRPSSSPATAVMYARDDATLGRWGMFGTDSEELYCQLGGNVAAQGGTVPLNEWAFAVFVYTFSTSLIALYLNGALVPQTPTALSANSATGQSTIGERTYSGYQGYFPGDIAEVAIFPTALTATQVAALYDLRVISGAGA